jgi:hypothetical protein
MAQNARKIYRTMQGKQIDMDLLRQRNELTPAVGNAKVNARGDVLGAGGKIIKTREDVMASYYRDNPSAFVPSQQPAAKPAKPEPVVEAAQPVKQSRTAKKAAAQPVQDNWVEDADGNFVPKE